MYNRLKNVTANITTFFAALIPVFKSCPPCPLCMPKYAALFSFFGLELADYSHYLIPIMILSMLVSLGSMLFQAFSKGLSIYPFIGLCGCRFDDLPIYIFI